MFLYLRGEDSPHKPGGNVEAQQLRDALEELGIAQVEAARRLRVSDRTVRYWVSGEREIPGPVSVVVECWRAERQLRRALGIEEDGNE